MPSKTQVRHDWFFILKICSLRLQAQKGPLSSSLLHDPTHPHTHKRLEKISELEKGQNRSARKKSLVTSESLRINTELCPIGLGRGDLSEGWGTALGAGGAWLVVLDTW